jgi:putative holliday junction resolvase
MPDAAPLSIDELAERLPPGQPLIGLDVGTKTIGIAVSDRRRQIASPRETIRRTSFSPDAARLLDLAQAERAAAIIVGLPVNMDGSEGPRAQSTRAFARNLARLTTLPIAFWDERLSSAVIERMLIEADRSRARRAELVDKLAAAYILQGALDRLARIGEPDP